MEVMLSLPCGLICAIEGSGVAACVMALALARPVYTFTRKTVPVASDIVSGIMVQLLENKDCTITNGINFIPAATLNWPSSRSGESFVRP